MKIYETHGINLELVWYLCKPHHLLLWCKISINLISSNSIHPGLHCSESHLPAQAIKLHTLAQPLYLERRRLDCGRWFTPESCLSSPLTHVYVHTTKLWQSTNKWWVVHLCIFWFNLFHVCCVGIVGGLNEFTGVHLVSRCNIGFVYIHGMLHAFALFLFALLCAGVKALPHVTISSTISLTMLALMLSLQR